MMVQRGGYNTELLGLYNTGQQGLYNTRDLKILNILTELFFFLSSKCFFSDCKESQIRPSDKFWAISVF